MNGNYGPGGGENHWDEEEQRCLRCDSRYCVEACFAGEPGFVYMALNGWVTTTGALWQEAMWKAKGLDYGPDHPTRRVEWDTYTPKVIPRLEVSR